MKYRHTSVLRVLDVEGGGVFAVLEPEEGDAAYVAIELARSRVKRDAEGIAWVLWADRSPLVSVSLVPAGMTPGPWLAAAIAAPLTLDQAVPTSPEFLDWWRRICSGELQRGVLAGVGEGGDPLEHQDDEDRPKARRRVGQLANKCEADEDGRTLVLEVGANT